MLLKDTFERDIYRAIDPVVHANELDHLEGELSEFVMTSEVREYLNRFLDAYNDLASPGNGGWISGFFGSGKSHLLKIMAALLEDRQVAGKGAMDYILPKLGDDLTLKAALEQARMKHPSESILFNIVTFAPNAGRVEEGALLSAFMKAFNHHCGYFDGDQQHIAQLEYDLDRAGLLERFESRVEELCGKPWRQVRSSSLLYAKKVTQAFDEVCGNPEGMTENVISYYQDNYHPDIRMFARRVADYIGEHERGFRLNFFVDEVGQFIANNTSLMVDLQEIASELLNACKGDSWIFVTSQENVEDIVGEMKARSGNDFSKIKDRFLIRKPLASSGAKEVIRDRLLAKNGAGEALLESAYEDYRADFDVLFDFADGAKRYRQYQDAQEFASTFPFVPYQFEVFMTALRGLSDHNCFTGRHNSTGARSMLGVFQLVAQYICDEGANTEQGTLAPFDLMFEGLRNDLKSEVYAAISTAESQLDDETAVRLLKALLLVKYCQDFKATPGNLRVLLYGALSENTQELNAKVIDALDLLERQVYVRRNGNVYEYLTNDEKEVENEIGNTLVQESQTRELIARLFKDVCGPSKVTYKDGAFEHSYAYNLKIDGEALGAQKNDLTVNLMTANPDAGMFADVVPTPPKTLVIALRDSRDFVLGVRTFKQTELYTQIASGGSDVRASIIADKQAANGKLYARLKGQLEELLSSASYNAGGVDITENVSGTSAAAVNSAAQQLVLRSYTGLQQIRTRLTDNDVYEQCVATAMQVGLPEYCETVLSRLRLTRETGPAPIAGDAQTSLVGIFSKNEYGWPEIAVRSAVACLYAANRVEVRKGGSVLEAAQLADALKRRRDLDKLAVSVVEEVSADELAALKQGYRSFVGTNPTGDDPKAISSELAGYAKAQIAAYEQSSGYAQSFPFSAAYDEKLAALRACAANAADRSWVLAEFPGKAQALAEANDDLRRMKSFIDGSQMGERWKQIRAFLDSEARGLEDLGLAGGELDAIRQVADDAECYKSKRIPEAFAQMEELREAASRQRDELRAKAQAALGEYRRSYEDTYDVDGLPQEGRARFSSLFEEASGELARSTSAYVLRTFVDGFKQQHAADLNALFMPKREEAPVAGDPNSSSAQDHAPEGARRPAEPVRESQPRAVSVAALDVSGYRRPAITNEAEALQYVDALKSAILAVIDAGGIVVS